jgi:hypothetical protein
MSDGSFDFWIGTWDVSWESDGTRQTGTNSVSRVDESIRELFHAPADGYIGASVSRWDKDASSWVQDYWDNNGYSAVFRGSLSDDRMVLERTSTPSVGALTRLVWSDILEDSITWNYERRNDDGTWESTWRILYTRRPATEREERSREVSG